LPFFIANAPCIYSEVAPRSAWCLFARANLKPLGAVSPIGGKVWGVEIFLVAKSGGPSSNTLAYTRNAHFRLRVSNDEFLDGFCPPKFQGGDTPKSCTRVLPLPSNT